MYHLLKLTRSPKGIIVPGTILYWQGYPDRKRTVISNENNILTITGPYSDNIIWEFFDNNNKETFLKIFAFQPHGPKLITMMGVEDL